MFALAAGIDHLVLALRFYKENFCLCDRDKSLFWQTGLGGTEVYG